MAAFGCPPRPQGVREPRGKLFYRLAQQAVTVDPAPYKSLIMAARAGPAGKAQDVGVT